MSTIRDVARAAGVSTATVSNVLNGRSERVSERTRERVFLAIRTLRYRPTAMENNQRAILTRNLGVMVEDLTTGPVGRRSELDTEPWAPTPGPLERHGYFRQILDGVLEASALRGWSVTIFVERMWYDVGQAVRRSYDGRCDGLISAAAQPGNEVVEALHSRGTPVVLVGSTPWLPGVSSVDLDNLAAGEIAARHLTSLGHRHLAYVGHRAEQVSSVERRESFFRAASHLGIPESNLHWIRCDSSDDSNAEVAWRQVLRLSPRPTGLFCWHDGLARELVSAAAEHNVRVPEDVSLISVDNAPEAQCAYPRLTTMLNPVSAQGRRAATMLIDQLTFGRDLPENVRFMPELIAGETSGPAPG